MRAILRKLYRHQELTGEEYDRLMQYAQDLRQTYQPAYEQFYGRFAAILYQDYHVSLPYFNCGLDDVLDYLLSNPGLVGDLGNKPYDPEMFPPHLRDYLQSIDLQDTIYNHVLPTLELIKSRADIIDLPRPRNTSLVCKFETGNPLKEAGLKAHFDRVGSYSFVSRIQSVRYLRGSKASRDKFEVISADCLGGIFTNKEKSIYYYVFLTENDLNRANNACRVLNGALYGSHLEEANTDDN